MFRDITEYRQYCGLALVLDQRATGVKRDLISLAIKVHGLKDFLGLLLHYLLDRFLAAYNVPCECFERDAFELSPIESIGLAGSLVGFQDLLLFRRQNQDRIVCSFEEAP